MKPNKFTVEQQEELRKNPNTYKVTESTIKFRKEFKEKVLEELNEGKAAERILMDAGYDVEVLGPNRIRRLADRVREEAESPEGIRETNKPRKRQSDLPNYEGMADKEAMRHMQGEILYLHQELEFIKKTISAARSEKQKK